MCVGLVGHKNLNDLFDVDKPSEEIRATYFPHYWEEKICNESNICWFFIHSLPVLPIDNWNFAFSSVYEDINTTSKTFRPFCYLRGFCEWDTQSLLGAPIETLKFDCLANQYFRKIQYKGVFFFFFAYSNVLHIEKCAVSE